MASKPTIALARWADTLSAIVTAPTSGLRDTGFVGGTIIDEGTVNWEINQFYQWALYISDGALSGDISTTGALTVGAQLLSFTDFTFTADSSTDQLAATAHGLHTGDGPVHVSNVGGALPSPLVAGVDYYAILVDTGHLQLAASRDCAIEGLPIDLLSNGTGTQTLQHQAGTTRITDTTVSRTLSVGGAATLHDVTVGGEVFTFGSTMFVANATTDTLAIDNHPFRTGSGPLRVTNSGGALPSPLVAGTDYWAIRSNSGKFSLATSRANALAGVLIDLTTSGTGTNSIASGTGTAHTSSLIVNGAITASVLKYKDPQPIFIPASEFRSEPGSGSPFGELALGAGPVVSFLVTGAPAVWAKVPVKPGQVIQSVVFWINKNGNALGMQCDLKKQDIAIDASHSAIATATDTSSGSSRSSVTLTPNYTVESGFFIWLKVTQTTTGSGANTVLAGAVVAVADPP